VTLRETVLETGVSAGAFVALLPPRGERGEERGENRRARATVDVSRPLARGMLRTGAAYDRIDLRHHLQTGGVSARTETSGESAGAYLDLSWLPVPRLALRGGLRGDYFATAGEARLAPRISATWRIGDRAELVGALGRYHQYVRELPGRTETGERALPAPGSAQLEVGGATHVTAGLHQEMDAGIRLGMEAYYKSFDAAAARLVEANASGVDLWVRRDEGAVRGWLGYSLVWNWTAGAGPDAAFVGRQILNAGARFSPGAAVELEGRLSYGAGLPFTGILLHASPDATAPGERRQVRALAASAAEEPMVGPPSDAFLRLDVTASRPFDARIAGRTHSLTPYLRVMNALDRRDASFYFADDPHAPARPIAELPILPWPVSAGGSDRVACASLDAPGHPVQVGGDTAPSPLPDPRRPWPTSPTTCATAASTSTSSPRARGCTTSASPIMRRGSWAMWSSSSFPAPGRATSRGRSSAPSKR
jgi:hypothetical protein